ncbi:hypothetical protein BD779DRAFT_1511404 [Infundibulicybe gibba]|nr:hypothetical protein BD779DRAFT_1511404 [Infundibulicybe gibba]
MGYSACQVCISTFDLSEFRVFPCGHGFCDACTDGLFKSTGRKSAPCPTCRTGVRRSEIIQKIYLELVDPKTATFEAAVDGLASMDENSNPISVKMAERKLKTVTQEEDPAAIATLNGAIRDFSERIVPLFDRIESQAECITALQSNLEEVQRQKTELKAQVDKMKNQKDEIAALRGAVRDAECNTERACRLAESAKDEVLKLRSIQMGWEQSNQKLNQDNLALRANLERYSKAARVQKEKISALKAQITTLSTHHPQTTDGLPAIQNADILQTGRNNAPSRSLAPSSTRSQHSAEHTPLQEFDFGIVPGPRFQSDWQISNQTIGKDLGGRKRKLTETGNQGRGSFPINLDHKGQPKIAVQIGPKKTRRVCIT